MHSTLFHAHFLPNLGVSMSYTHMIWNYKKYPKLPYLLNSNAILSYSVCHLLYHRPRGLNIHVVGRRIIDNNTMVESQYNTRPRIYDMFTSTCCMCKGDLFMYKGFRVRILVVHLQVSEGSFSAKKDQGTGIRRFSEKILWLTDYRGLAFGDA